MLQAQGRGAALGDPRTSFGWSKVSRSQPIEAGAQAGQAEGQDGDTREDRSKGHCLHLGAHLGLDPCITPGTGELQLASQACSVSTLPHHHAWEQAQAHGSTGHPLEEPESHRARPALAEQCPLSSCIPAGSNRAQEYPQPSKVYKAFPLESSAWTWMERKCNSVSQQRPASEQGDPEASSQLQEVKVGLELVAGCRGLRGAQPPLLGDLRPAPAPAAPAYTAPAPGGPAAAAVAQHPQAPAPPAGSPCHAPAHPQ